MVGANNAQGQFCCQGNFNGPRVIKIPSSKHQITNKSQIPISNDQNRFGILVPPLADYLFDI
jgi:hypothetical protein